RLAEAAADARGGLEASHERGQHRGLVPPDLLAARQGRGPDRRAVMGYRLDVGIVEIEAVRQGAVGERGEWRRGRAAEEHGGPALAAPRGRDLANDASGGFLAGADRDAEPIGEAEARHVGDLRGKDAL